jgi:hypothetical protein
MSDPNPFRREAHDLPLRLAGAEEGGRPFLDVLYEAAGNRPNGARLAALIQEWGLLADELGRDPTADEYADRFKFSKPTAHRDLRIFREAFPTEQTPRRILALLWDGVEGEPTHHLLSVKVKTT